jgi:HEAT repeat protein
VKVVVDNPKRLDELVGMLEDRNLAVRGRAAATIGRLAETHTRRLVRILSRIREGLSDESAYVRWSLAHALGRIAAAHPNSIAEVLTSLVPATEDDNRLVRVLACRAVARIYSIRPQQVRGYFENGKKAMPESVARSLKKMEKHRSRPKRHTRRPD